MMFKILPALLAALILTACSSVQSKERLLSAAGFHTIVPTSPKQIAQLKTLPQLQVVPVNKKGKTFFLFADATHNTLLIGSQKEYTAYQQYALQYKIQQDKVEAASLNADASEWGGFGGMDGGFYGPGFY